MVVIYPLHVKIIVNIIITSALKEKFQRCHVVIRMQTDMSIY